MRFALLISVFFRLPIHNSPQNYDIFLFVQQKILIFFINKIDIVKKVLYFCS